MLSSICCCNLLQCSSYLFNTDEPLCRKHNKRYEYIHRPRKAGSIQKFKGKKIQLKPGKYILRGKNYITLLIPSALATTTEKYNFVQFNIGEPCKHYLDEFSRHVVWGNTVRLYNHNVCALRKIIRSTTRDICNKRQKNGNPLQLLCPISYNSMV